MTPIRVNVTPSQFPFISALIGKSVLVAQGDLVGVKHGTYEAGPPFVAPQLMYAQNVLPTSYGLASVTYTTEAAPTTGALTAINRPQLHILRDDLNVRTLFLADPENPATYNSNDTAWVSHDFGIGSDGKITVAVLKEQTYICVAGVGLYTFSVESNQFVQVFPSGLDTAMLDFGDVLGVVAANTYLILYTADTLYFSSVTDPLDFAPSRITGAGFTKVLELKSNIEFCAPLAGGFVIYTVRNAVMALATGNLATPYIFKEIENCPGVALQEHVTYDSTAGSHIAWTSSGLMELNKTGAQVLFPEVMEFINARLHEHMEVAGTTLSLQLTPYSETAVRLNMLGAKYLCISYGEAGGQQFDGALVFDLGLKRWGRLVMPHLDIFEFELPPEFELGRCSDYPTEQCDDVVLGERACSSFTFAITESTNPRELIGVVTPTGRLQKLSLATMDAADYVTETASIAIFGKYQMERGWYTMLTGVEAASIRYPSEPLPVTAGGDAFDTGLYIRTSFSMQARQATYQVEQSSRTQSAGEFITGLGISEIDTSVDSYPCLVTGISHDLVMVGEFDISNLEVQALKEGRI